MMRQLSQLLLATFLLTACADGTSEGKEWEPENELTWTDAIRVLNEGKVVFVSQSHSLWVGFELEDGTSFFAKEPVIDEIFRELDRCEACGEILISME